MHTAANVIEFRPAKRPTRPAKLTIAEARKAGRFTWEKTLRAYWADDDNWRGDEITIDTGKVTIKATIEPQSGYWIWCLWRLGRVQLKSPWIYVDKGAAFASALDAVIAVV